MLDNLEMLRPRAWNIVNARMLRAYAHAARQDGNPHGVFVHHVNGLLAGRVGALPEVPWYNVVRGIDGSTIANVPEMLEFFGAIQPTLIVTSSNLTPTVENALTGLGFSRQVTSCLLCRDLREPIAVVESTVEVVEADAGAEDSELGRVLADGYGFSDGAHRHFFLQENLFDGVRRYKAMHDGVLAGVGLFFAMDELAFLGGAATLPSHRGSGVQSTLIARRLSDASRTCRAAVVTTSLGSKSQANLQKSGFEVLDTAISFRRSMM